MGPRTTPTTSGIRPVAQRWPCRFSMTGPAPLLVRTTRAAEIYVINQDGKEAVATIWSTIRALAAVSWCGVQRECGCRGGKVCALRDNAFDPIGVNPAAE